MSSGLIPGDKMTEAGKGQLIHISVKYNGNIHKLITYPNEYRSLMMLIGDRLFMESFGECRGMGKCGTCLVEIISNPHTLTGFDRNEHNSLLRAGSTTENKRLSCQLIIDEQMDGAEIKVLQ